PPAERPAAQVVLEPRKLIEERAEHFLEQVIEIRSLNVIPSEPSANERRVQIDETLAGMGIRTEAKPLQKADRCVVQGDERRGFGEACRYFSETFPRMVAH